MKIMGIDIGTTTVSIVLTDTETGKQLARETVEHNSFLQSSRPEQKIQDPGQIYEIVRELLAKMQGEHGLPDGIGFTGQMHGMLYVDASGMAVSPLYTWQDGSGEIPLEDGRTCVEILSLLSDLTWRQAGAALTCENRSFCMKPWSRPA